MLKPFKTTKTIENFNVILRLLTPAKMMTYRSAPVPLGAVTEVPDERCYLLGICDWCGQREIIDDPEPDSEIPFNRSWNLGARVQAFVNELNWVVGDRWMRESGQKGRQFCSRKCRDTHDIAVMKGDCPT